MIYIYKKNYINLFLALFTLFVIFSCQTSNESGVKPNILVIVSDDQGYSDLGYQTKGNAETPNIDKLAESGIICSNGYVSCPFCSPSRAGLLTGRYQERYGHEFNPVYDPLDTNEGLPLSERLLPEYLKDVGYHTGCIGKWHLGTSPSHTPNNRGFDFFFGFLGGGHHYMNWEPNIHQYNLPIMRNNKPVEVKEHLTTLFGNEASDFINRNTKSPWFLYLAFNAPHMPHEPLAEYERKFEQINNPRRRKYLAQICMLDDAVGNVLNTLKESGQTDRTLVFYFSDNGGSIPHGANNWPLRGGKGELYEGGVRVPFLVYWPGKLPPGKIYDMPVISLDVFATAMDLAGIEMPEDKKYDGINIVPFLTGETVTSPHPQLFWRRHAGEAFAIREKSWKLIRKRGEEPELYNLSKDISETENLYYQESDIAEHLIEELEAWNEEIIMPVFSGSYVKDEDWGPGGVNVKNAKKNPYITSWKKR